MLRFIVTRVGLVIPTFIGVTLLAFAMIRLIPGDPIELLVGERGLDPERHAELRAALGLDKPLLEQYRIYITDVAEWPAMQPVLAETLAGITPPNTAIICDLVDPRMKVEIEATARKRNV